MKVVAVANQKGGVGKTTTSVNLSACLAELGCKVLLIDIDPQGNASSGLGVDRDQLTFSSYHVLLEECQASAAIVATPYESLSLIPSHPDLAGAEVELVSRDAREYSLKRILSGLQGEWDFVLLDCPPSLGLLTVNALVASDSVLVPVQAEFYALEGMGQLLHTIELVHEHLNPALSVEGILLTMYDGRTNLSQQVAEEVYGHFGDLVFSTVIPRNVRLSEAPSYGQAIVSYDSGSTGATRYRALSREFLERNHYVPGDRVSA